MSASVKSTAQKLVQKTLQSIASGSLSGPAGIAAKVAKKTLGKISEATLGYDFANLIVGLIFFYIIALLADGFLQAVIKGSGFVSFIAKLFGKSIPNVLPQAVIDFYNNGYKGILQYWDVVHIIALSAVAFEAYSYYEGAKQNGKRPNAMTIAVFGMISGTIALMVFPSLYQKAKEIQTLGTTIPETPTTFAPSNIGPAWLPSGFSYVIGSDKNYYALVQRADGTPAYQLALQTGPNSGTLTGPLLVSVP